MKIGSVKGQNLPLLSSIKITLGFLETNLQKHTSSFLYEMFNTAAQQRYSLMYIYNYP